MKILFLHNGQNDISTRTRVHPYFPFLTAEGIFLEEFPERPYILNEFIYHETPVDCHKGLPFKFKVGYFIQLLEMILNTLRSPFYDILFLQRFIFPHGFDRLDRLYRISRHLAIDIQDAIFCSTDNEEPIYEKRLRKICNMASLVTVSNKFMADWIGQPEKTIIMPTVVNSKSVPIRNYDLNSDKVIIGWCGQVNQLSFIRPLFGVLAELIKNENVEVWFFTSTIKDTEEIKKMGIKIVPFNKEREFKILQQIDIGLVPIPYSLFNLGKFPLKLINHMATGASVVCSPVGSNLEIIEDGVHGYFADKPDEWYKKICELVHDRGKRITMGKEGRKKVEKCYSAEANWPRLKNALMRLGPAQK